MQGMTHFAVGILGYSCYRSAATYLQKADAKHISAVNSDTPSLKLRVLTMLLLLLILVLLVASHVILDALAMATYHPPKVISDSIFWFVFHTFVAGVTVFLLWKYRSAGLFLLASVLPDTDWIARPFGLWPEGAAHEFFRSLPGLRAIDSALRAVLPDWRWQAWASVNELALFAGVMIFTLFFVRMHADNKPRLGR